MKITSWIGIGLLFFLLACSKEKTFDCIKSTGQIIKEERYFDNVSILLVEDNINVILVQSLPGKIIVEAGDNLLPKIKCEQSGTTLKISNKNTCNWVRSYDKPMNIYVGVDQVKEIRQQGYGKISNSEFMKTDTLRIYNFTYGDSDIWIHADFVGFIADDHSSIRLKGKSKKVAGSCAKNALVDASEMSTGWFVLTSNSMLDAKIYCDSLLQVEIKGDGNILCFGHPKKVQYNHPSGPGSLQFP